MTNPYLENTVFGRYWQDKIRQTNQLIRENPEIHSAFRSWYSSYIQAYAKPPAPSYTIEQVERLLTNLYKHRQASQALANTNQSIRMASQAMSTGYAYKRPYAGGYQTAPKRIRIIPSSLPSYRPPPPPPPRPAVVLRSSPGEVKGVDIPLGTVGTPIVSTTTTNDNFFLLNGIQTGSGSFNRVGKRITPKSVRITGTAQFSTLLSANKKNGNWLRFIVLWDKQPSGNPIPAFDKVFGRVTQNGTATTTTSDSLKYENMDRFRILKEWVIVSNPMSEESGTSETDYVYKFDEYIKLKGLETVYSGSSNPTTITDITTGSLYLVCRSYINTPALTFVELGSDSLARFRYRD